MVNVMSSLTFLLLPALYSCSTSHGSGLSWQEYVTQETLLRTDLIDNTTYSRKIRPAETMDVNVRYNLLSINSLDMKTQTFSTSGWLTMKWYDLRLAWEKDKYHNITYMFDTEDKLWRPEIIIDNSVTSIGVIHDSALLMRVRHDGLVMWEPPGIHTVHCEIDTSYYPFDGQKCALDISSWAYNIEEVNLTHMSTVVNLRDYMVNGEWSLLNTYVTRSELVEEEETFCQLKFIFHLHRRPFYYVINIMIPIGLTSVLSIIVFILPFESGEKVSYSLTVLLSYAVLMTIVAANMPPTSIKVSVLAIYLALILFVGCTSVILSVINLHIYHQKEERPVPKSLKRFVRGFLLRVVKTKEDERLNSRTRILPVEYTQTKNQKMSREQQRAWQEKADAVNKEASGDKYSWSEIAMMFDTFLFKLYMVFVVLATLCFFIAMAVGGYFVEPTLTSSSN